MVNVAKANQNNVVLDQLIFERGKLIEGRNKTYNEKTNRYEDDGAYDRELDQNADAIFTFIRDNFDNVFIEDILLAGDHCGHAPCLLSNDNGSWTVTCSGMQNISMDPSWDFEGTFFVEKDEWFPTIREAVLRYVNGVCEGRRNG